VLVTGASGYIALWVVKTLLAAGFRVRGTVRSLKAEQKMAPVRAVAAEFPAGLFEAVEADLLEPAGWAAAVSGCTYVLHLASPFPLQVPADASVLEKPARDGTLNVLRACAAAVPRPRRVVVTSSIAAIGYGTDWRGRVYTEADWTDLANPAVDPYPRSKTLAERAAWEFLESLPAEARFELATVNPGFVLGPMLTAEHCTSAEALCRMLGGGMPLVPDVWFSCVDVRDVARAHVLAMLRPEAAGQRFVCAGFEANLRDFARMLAREFNPQGYAVKTGGAPDCAIRLGACCGDQAMVQLTKQLGVRQLFSSDKAARVLGLSFAAADVCVLDMAYSLIENGLVPNKTKGSVIKRDWVPHADGLGPMPVPGVPAVHVAVGAEVAAAGASAMPAAVAVDPLAVMLGDSPGAASKVAEAPAGATLESATAAGTSTSPSETLEVAPGGAGAICDATRAPSPRSAASIGLAAKALLAADVLLETAPPATESAASLAVAGGTGEAK